MKKSDRGIAFIVCGAVAVYLLASSLYIFFSVSASPDAMRILGILNILVLALCLFLTCHLGRKRKAAQKYTAARAESSGRAKAVHLNNISHDLRTRLNAIIGYASIARKQAEAGSSVLDFLDKIGTAGNELLELADQTLDISRVDSGSAALEREYTHTIDSISRFSASM